MWVLPHEKNNRKHKKGLENTSSYPLVSSLVNLKFDEKSTVITSSFLLFFFLFYWSRWRFRVRSKIIWKYHRNEHIDKNKNNNLCLLRFFFENCERVEVWGLQCFFFFTQKQTRLNNQRNFCINVT